MSSAIGMFFLYQRVQLPALSLYSSIDKLEEEIGHPLVIRGGDTRLTKAGILLLPEARERIAAAPPVPPKSTSPSGRKAKASKGKGRTPVVKGQPKPYKKRQGR